MTLYTNAVTTITEHAQQTQARLDAAATEARAKNLNNARKLALQGVDPGSPLFPVAALVANTLEIGREDGYPEWRLPKETLSVLKAALEAEILVVQNQRILVGALRFYHDLSGVVCWDGPIQETNDADYQAWKESRNYRRKQTYKSL